MSEGDGEWEVACSDDDNYGFTQDGDHWLPPNQDIVSYYTALSKGEKLELDWSCIARRPPTPEVDDDANGKPDVELEQTTEENKAEVTEFDFDEPELEPNPITPKRTPGSAKIPKSQKRVARLDKIMNDMFRHKKLNADAKSAHSTANQDRIISSVSVQKQSPRGSPRGSPKPAAGFPSPRGSPRASPKPSGGFPSPRGGSPKPSVGSPKQSVPPTPNMDTPQRDSPKNRMSPKRLT